MGRLQLNLVPDIKLTYIKQERTRKLVVSAALLATAISVGILLLMIATVYVVQKKQLNDSSRDITSTSNQLRGLANLDQILTVQNQLDTLVGLHQTKHMTSRVFTYLAKVTPSKVAIGHIVVDVASSRIQIDGTADSHRSINVFIDSLKYTSYRFGGGDKQPAFSNVVETSFSITPTGANYSVSFKFNPALFANSKFDSKGRPVKPVLSVPRLTTTRTAVDDPNNLLFDGRNRSGGN